MAKVIKVIRERCVLLTCIGGFVVSSSEPCVVTSRQHHKGGIFLCGKDGRLPHVASWPRKAPHRTKHLPLLRRITLRSQSWDCENGAEPSKGHERNFMGSPLPAVGASGHGDLRPNIYWLIRLIVWLPEADRKLWGLSQEPICVHRIGLDFFIVELYLKRILQTLFQYSIQTPIKLRDAASCPFQTYLETLQENPLKLLRLIHMNISPKSHSHS